MTSEKVTFRNGNEGVSTDERYSGWSSSFYYLQRDQADGAAEIIIQ